MLIHILRLFGLLPVSIKRLSFSTSVLQPSKIQFLYTIFVAVFLTTACILIFLSFLNNVKHLKFTEVFIISSILMVANANAVQISSIICLLLVLSRVQKKIHVFEKFKEIDFLLQIQQNNFFKLRFISCIAIVHILVVIFTVVYRNEYGALMLFAHPCKLVNLCASIEFMEVVLGVKERFANVNKLLKEVVAKKLSFEVYTVSLPCVESFLERPNKQSLNIQQLRIVHWKLCVLVQDISDTYGLTVLVLISALVVHLTFYTNSLVLMYNKNDTVQLFTHIHRFIMHLCQLYIIVWPCSLAITEAGKTNSVISLMMSNVNQMADKSDQLFNQLDMFSQHLFLQKVDISICGLFSVEAFTVVSIVSAVTTYLAIIFQVESSANN